LEEWPITYEELQKKDRQKRNEYRRFLGYERARARRGEPMPLDRAQRLLWTYCDSYERLGEVLSYSRIMARRPWLKLLGEAWSMVDNVAEWEFDLRVLLPDRTCLLMMAPDERERWRELPAKVTIYRGCSPVNAAGLSWSLDPAIAARFPTRARYSPPKGQPPLLVTATVARSRIVAVKLDRKEEEVITSSARPVSETALS
jgi:hypothetical protein